MADIRLTSPFLSYFSMMGIVDSRYWRYLLDTGEGGGKRGVSQHSTAAQQYSDFLPFDERFWVVISAAAGLSSTQNSVQACLRGTEVQRQVNKVQCVVCLSVCLLSIQCPLYLTQTVSFMKAIPYQFHFQWRATIHNHLQGFF